MSEAASVSFVFCSCVSEMKQTKDRKSDQALYNSYTAILRTESNVVDKYIVFKQKFYRNDVQINTYVNLRFG